MNKLLTIVAVYIVTFFISIFAHSKDKSFYIREYYIDWPKSNSKTHTLRISINGCESLFEIDNNSFESFVKDDGLLNKTIEIAKERSFNGCI